MRLIVCSLARSLARRTVRGIRPNKIRLPSVSGGQGEGLSPRREEKAQAKTRRGGPREKKSPTRVPPRERGSPWKAKTKRAGAIGKQLSCRPPRGPTRATQPPDERSTTSTGGNGGKMRPHGFQPDYFSASDVSTRPTAHRAPPTVHRTRGKLACTAHKRSETRAHNGTRHPKSRRQANLRRRRRTQPQNHPRPPPREGDLQKKEAGAPYRTDGRGKTPRKSGGTAEG